MRFSIYQMEIIPGNPEANRKKIKAWIEKVVMDENPDTIVLPELWNTSYVLEQLVDVADEEGIHTKQFLSELAAEKELNIIGGSIANKIDDQIYNTSYVYNSRGELVYEYSKIHLVPMLDEHLYLTGGTKGVQVFELAGIKMGIIICYDLRFPELARSLALQGAQVLFVVAEWPVSRRNHWITLQIARAIENQMYVVSSNNVGRLNGVIYGGTSMLIDPWGVVIQEGSIDSEETITSLLNAEKVSEVRKSIPIFTSRVPDLYK